MRVILFQSSQTQRVAVSIDPKNNQSILLSKEWRKSTKEEWLVGKSIELPYSELDKVQEILKRVSNNRGVQDEKILEQIFTVFTDCEVITSDKA